jgi:ketosteroid isomerase-like protein
MLRPARLACAQRRIDLSSASTSELADKFAIQEVLYKFARAADRCDKELFHSLYHPGATADHGGVFVGSAADFVELVISALSQMGVTTHHILNTLIDLHGDTAGCEAYAIHQHRVEKDGEAFDSIMALRHLHRFERRDGAWRIVHHHVVYDWNRDVATSETWGRGLFGATFNTGKKDKSDPVYAF